MTGLQISGVSKAFGAHPVLRGIDLDVPKGSFASVLGPSGSGKTTLLRVITGFERSDDGSVALDGVVLEDRDHALSPARRRIGYVPQEGSLFPHLNVAANVAFGLARRERRAQRVAALLEMVDLEGLERRYPHQLSGGQQQRVALARALAVRPSLVLLDEPFSSLDASLRQSVRQDVRRVLAEAGTTALLVTHDQEEALSLSDLVAVIEGGRIGQCDNPEGLYARPGSPALARGLGGANILPGVARAGGAETVLGVLPCERWQHADGTALAVLVRPEQIDLAARPADGSAAAEVLGCEYYGHDAVVRVRGEWAPEAQLTVRVADVAALPDVGARVGLSVHGSVVAWPARSEDQRGRGADSPHTTETSPPGRGIPATVRLSC